MNPERLNLALFFYETCFFLYSGHLKLFVFLCSGLPDFMEAIFLS